MENEQSEKSNDEPNSKRPKIESGGSTSAKPESKDPFLSLPSDIHVKIIGYIPIAQWPSLELLDKNFRAATLIAYRQLRNINVERDLLIKFEKADDRSKFAKSIKLILQKLVERSPFLSSIGGIYLRADSVPLLVQFEHLQSISLGEGMHFVSRQGIQLENVNGFLESTRSRTSLTELRWANIVQGRANSATARFDSSFVNGRELQSPLKLEKFSFGSSDRWLQIRLDTLDTSRLTDVRLGNATIEPHLLANLIERAMSLSRIELSFLQCPERDCNGSRLQANKELLNVLASHGSLTAIKFDSASCTGCACIHFVPEFIQMLKNIGDRGQLRKLSIEKKLFHFYHDNIHMNEICATICNSIPFLQSIKLRIVNIYRQNVFNIVSLPELEEIDLMHSRIPMTSNIIKKLAQLPRLKRLALHHLRGGEDLSSKYLAVVTTLKDLRIEDARGISADVWEKWSNGFASNLECFMVGGVDNENGLIRLLGKAVRLRVLILNGIYVTDRLMTTIAQSCPKVEILGLQSTSDEITNQLSWCPNPSFLGERPEEQVPAIRFPSTGRSFIRSPISQHSRYLILSHAMEA